MMNRRLALLLACVICLIALGSALPAADPRIDPPTIGHDRGAAVDSWNDSVEPSADEPPTTTPEPADPESDISIERPLVPGTNVSVEVSDYRLPEGDGIDPLSTDDPEYTIRVNDEYRTVTNPREFTVAVPFDREMTVEVPLEAETEPDADGTESLRRNATVRTDAAITLHGGVAPKRNVTAEVSVAGRAIPNAAVYRDGETVGRTDEEGRVSVLLPERVGETRLRAARKPVEGERTVELPEPEISIGSPVVLPGLPAPVTVTGDGVGIPDIDVSLADGGGSKTDGDGFTRVWMPIDNEVTLTASVGGETATTTVSGLYRRLTFVVVVLPGIAIGLTWTYLRYLSKTDRRAGSRFAGINPAAGIARAFVSIGDILTAVTDSLLTLRRVRPAVSLPSLPTSLSVPSLSWPALSLSRPENVTFPSVFSGSRSSGDGGEGWLSSSLNRFGDGDANEDEKSVSSEELDDEGSMDPRTEIQRYWHDALDRLSVEDREVRTPGEVARRAIAAGFPEETVRRLLGLFRDVEYGGQDPTDERISVARRTAREIIEHDTDDEDSQ